LNVPKPVDKEYHEDWPNCNIFGVMDGHGGSKCADFLKENFHHYVNIFTKTFLNYRS